jgi:hypothetical protein
LDNYRNGIHDLNQPDLPGHPLTKYGVVLSPGPPDAWDGAMVESPAVWHDDNAARYAMVYVGYALTSLNRRGYETASSPHVGLAWSDDLLLWQKDPRNPIYGPSPSGPGSDTHGTSGPFIFFWEDRYHLYYFSTSRPGYEKGIKALHHATSHDLITWNRDPNNPVISPDGSGWRSAAIWHPHIVHRNGRFWLFFNASGNVDGFDEETIGVAESVDLYRWTVRDDINPVLVGSRRRGAWDSTGRAGDPSLFSVDGCWFMAYYSWDGIHSRDGLAWTTDEEFPVGWRPFDKNPVLDIGLPDSYDALHAGKPFIFRTADRHFHFYTAVAADDTRQIALATAQL